MLQDAAEQELASSVLDHFSQTVLPQLSKLPHGELQYHLHDCHCFYCNEM